ncbi:MAG: N-acetylmuramoyl-L-alanine amidase [Bdellovibrionales bacterium]|nr:N-acetylmuramoyl-L-alanine amidase [Bdellovibrionales bacterium]
MLIRILASLLLYLLFATTPSTSLAMHVVLDPGHGGRDTGATQGKIAESEITLKIANIVAKQLLNDSRFTVSLTRKDDSYISLEERATIANKKGDLFLSIHVNSSTDSRVHGQEIYFQNQLPPNQESLFLASRENQNVKIDRYVPKATSPALANKKLNADVRSIIEDLERNHRFKLSGLLAEKLYYSWQDDSQQKSNAIRQAPFFVVSNVDKPSVLIEVGYLTNAREAKKLMSPDHQEQIADNIYRAILSFKESLDKPTNKSLN